MAWSFLNLSLIPEHLVNELLKLSMVEMHYLMLSIST